MNAYAHEGRIAAAANERAGFRQQVAAAMAEGGEYAAEAVAESESTALRTMQAEPVRYLYDFTDVLTGDVTEEVSKVDRSGEPRVSNVRPLYTTPAAPVAERCAAIADDLASDELFLDEKGRFGAELVAASIRDEFDLADATAKSQAAPPAPASVPVVKVLPTELNQIGMTLNFFASVIKSGEPWTGTCQRELDAAHACLSQVRSALSDAPAREGWRSMDSAPKDGTKILVAYDSESDPYIEDEKTGRLTSYAAHAEDGDFLSGKGVTVAVWVPGWHESTDEYGSGYWMPGCWFAWFNGDTDYVVAPTGWMPLPAASPTGEDAR